MDDPIVRRIYDEYTFKQIYDDLLYPNFGMFTDELDTLETFIYLLKQHLFLYVYASFDNKNNITGCVCFEQFPKSKCTLLTYLAVKPEHQKKGIATALINRVLDVCKHQKAVFLETNQDSVQSKDVMSPALRRSIFTKLGFQCLNFPYVQPQLYHSHSKCYDLYLAIHKNYPLDANTIADFLKEFYNFLQPLQNNDLDLHNMLRFLQLKTINTLV